MLGAGAWGLVVLQIQELVPALLEHIDVATLLLVAWALFRIGRVRKEVSEVRDAQRQHETECGKRNLALEGRIGRIEGKLEER